MMMPFEGLWMAGRRRRYVKASERLSSTAGPAGFEPAIRRIRMEIRVCYRTAQRDCAILSEGWTPTNAIRTASPDELSQAFDF